MSPTANVAYSARVSNLKSANRARIEAAALLRDVRARRLTVADAIWDSRAEPLQLHRLLEAQGWWGAVKTERLCFALGISPSRLVRDLSAYQRRAVVAGIAARLHLRGHS